MPCQLLLQNTSGEVTFYLELDGGGPAEGLVFGDVVADMKKQGGAFVSLALDSSNFVELDDGFYSISLASTDTDVLGNLLIRLSSPGVRTALFSAYVAESEPVNPVITTPVPTTDVFGYVAGLDGQPQAGASVSARVLSTPALLSPGPHSVLLNTGLVTTKTDATGFFLLTLVTGSQVDVFIPSADYRRTITVPGTSQNLFTIP